MTNKRLKFRLSLPNFGVLSEKTFIGEMASFRDARLMLLDIYDDGLIDEEELLVLYDLNTSKNPVFPYESYERFELTDMDEAECKAEFRGIVHAFEKNGLPLPIQRSDPKIWQTSPRIMHDYNYSGRLRLRKPCSQNYRVE